MKQIPKSTLFLGLMGVIPFAWGALTLLSPTLANWGANLLGARFVGPYIQLSYGVIILAFMSGVLWGFATRSTGQQLTVGLMLSVVPALWAFFMIGTGFVSDSINLITGFIAVLILDWQFWRQGLTPSWWIHLRIILTTLVVAFLSLGII